MKKFLPVGVAIAVVVALLIVVRRSADVQHSTSQSFETDPFVALNAITAAHLAGKPADKWWLEEDVTKGLAGRKPLPKAASRRIEQQNKLLTDLMARYGSATPLAAEINNGLVKLGKFRVGIADKADLRILQDGDLEPTEKDEKEAEAALKLGYIPHGSIDATVAEHGNEVLYAAGSSTVMIPAIEWPETVLAGVFLHELGHAYRHRVTRKDKPLAPRQTIEHAVEEVEMHELASVIFDIATKGNYSKLLARILARARRDESPVWVMTSVTAQDLRDLDRILGAERAGPIPTSVIIAHTLMMVGFRQVDRAVAPADRTVKKAEFYNWYDKVTPR